VADWVGAALVLAPVAALLGVVTFLIWREQGWRGPAILWGVQIAFWVPIWLGLWIIHG
jgi:hypothetical protein